MQAKKFAIFIDSLGGGGAEKVMMTLATGLQAQGHYVHFFLLEPRFEYSADSVPFDVLYQDISHRISTSRRKLKQTAKDMQTLVDTVAEKLGGFDIHLVNLDPSCQVVARCHFENVHYVLHNATKQELLREAKLGPFKLFRKLNEKRVYHNKNVIAVSAGVGAEAENNWVFKPKNVQIIYNPTNIEQVVADSHEHNDAIPQSPYLVHAGRVVKQKRHDVLFKALKQLPDVKLVLLCSKIKKAQKLAKKLGVEEQVILPGFQDNPYPWFRQAQALVSSSDFEGLGMNLIDSLLCDTPVVSTDCPYGPNEILTGNLSQFLVPCNDPNALAEKIKQVLVAPPKINKEVLYNKFSLNAAVKRYLSLAQ